MIQYTWCVQAGHLDTLLRPNTYVLFQSWNQDTSLIRTPFLGPDSVCIFGSSSNNGAKLDLHHRGHVESLFMVKLAGDDDSVQPFTIFVQVSKGVLFLKIHSCCSGTPKCGHFWDLERVSWLEKVSWLQGWNNTHFYCSRTKQSVLIKQDVLMSGCPHFNGFYCIHVRPTGDIFAALLRSAESFSVLPLHQRQGEDSWQGQGETRQTVQRLCGSFASRPLWGSCRYYYEAEDSDNHVKTHRNLWH